MLVMHQLTALSVLLRCCTAALVGGALGIERGRRNRPAGLRTYMLVCLGSAIVMMTNQYIWQTFATGDPSRLGAQVISGIGFLGAGSIIVARHNLVRGLTTAAGLWAAACLGLAIGIGFYEVALIGTVLAWLTLAALEGLDAYFKRNTGMVEVYLELAGASTLTGFEKYVQEAGLTLRSIHLESDSIAEDGEVLAVVATVSGGRHTGNVQLLELLRKTPGLKYIEEI